VPAPPKRRYFVMKANAIRAFEAESERKSVKAELVPRKDLGLLEVRVTPVQASIREGRPVVPHVRRVRKRRRVVAYPEGF
jgi:hypothetical protein